MSGDVGHAAITNDLNLNKYFASTLWLRVRDYKNLIRGNVKDDSGFLGSLKGRFISGDMNHEIFKKEFLQLVEKIPESCSFNGNVGFGNLFGIFYN